MTTKLPALADEIQSDITIDRYVQADVVVTTYAIVQRDAVGFCDVGARFDAMVLDESQAIKNGRSHTARAINKIAGELVGGVRVALTGTPVENRLAELHSIVSFALPGYLGSLREFEEQFARPIERRGSRSSIGRESVATSSPKSDEAEAKREEARQRLLSALRPFVLRRTKSDPSVAGELPPKIELLHEVELSAPQRKLYHDIRHATMDTVPGSGPQPQVVPPSLDDAFDDDEALMLDAMSVAAQPSIEAQPGGLSPRDAKRRRLAEHDGSEGSGAATRRRQRTLALLHGLQQACNHPVAVGPALWPATLNREEPGFGNDVKNSGKLTRLLEIVEEILDAPREKVLVFTQYLRTLEMLVWSIAAAHPDVKIASLHGALSPSERDEAVRSFQEDPLCCVFVCTLGTGGVGLTLTEAAHVVHFDRCWNPAKEAQATDRAHRIGQRKTVVVHRFVCRGTFEERLAEIVKNKEALAQDAIPVDTGGSVVSSILDYSDEELRDLFALR